jgi:hypothetical protein
MSKIFCPFCLTIHDFGEPPICSERTNPEDGKHPDVSRSYIQNYERSAPLWLAAIGFSRHGKTSYLGSLSLILDSAEKFWEGSAPDYLDQYTFHSIQKAKKIIYSGGEVDKTSKWGSIDDENQPNRNLQGPPRPLLLRVNGIPEFQSRCLVLYDAAGEYFETFTGIQEGISQPGYIKSLKAVRTIWFMISLSDLASEENKGSRSLRDLLNVYISGMEKIGWDIRNRNLIVVYTKADKLKNIEDIPLSIRNYVFDDPYGPLVSKINNAGPSTFFKGIEREEFDLKKYISEMEEISMELERYTRKLPGGSAFLSMAANYELNVRFAITSALGTDVQDGKAIANFVSYRVLDPLLWALKLDDKPPVPTTIKLILDTNNPIPMDENSINTNPVFSLPFDLLIQELGKIGDEVVAFYLGMIKPCASSGQKPPSEPPKQKYSRILRPLLTEKSENVLAIVLTNGPIHDLDDLLDFQTDWLNRLLIVSLSKDYEPNWKYSFVFRLDDSIDLIINRFKKMLQDSNGKGK